jgi:hypothetical protein
LQQNAEIINEAPADNRRGGYAGSTVSESTAVISAAVSARLFVKAGFTIAAKYGCPEAEPMV